VIRLVYILILATALAAFSTAADAQQKQFVAPQKERFELPPRYRPPPGMCRIWLDSVPPNRQPAPTDCASAIRNVPPNARVIFSDSAAVRDRDRDSDKDRGKGKDKDRRRPDTTRIR
jgi:hypothetical protein